MFRACADDTVRHTQKKRTIHSNVTLTNIFSDTTEINKINLEHYIIEEKGIS